MKFKLFLICLFLIDCRLHCVFVAVCGVLHCLPCLCAGLTLSIVKRVERNVCFHVEYIVNSFSIISCISLNHSLSILSHLRYIFTIFLFTIRLKVPPPHQQQRDGLIFNTRIQLCLRILTRYHPCPISHCLHI